MPRSHSGLSGALFNLAEDILELVEQNSEYEPVELDFPRIDADVEYSPTSWSIQRSRKSESRLIWPQQILREIIKESSELESYQEVEGLLKVRIEDGNSKFYLEQFIEAILDESLPEVEYDTIVNIITIFEADIEHAPINWHPVVFLHGVHIDGDPIELDTGVEIRQPKESDFEYKIRVSNSPKSPFEVNPPRQEGEFPKPPSCILEFSKRTSSGAEVTEVINQHAVLLQLYNIGDVFISEQEYNPETLLHRGYSTAETHYKKMSSRSYTIGDDDRADFQLFVETLKENVMKRLVQSETDTALTIAYDRYANALDERQTPERQLTSAIMCLEALFLKEEERGELSERLSRRAGILLNQYDSQPNKVSRNIKQAYHIRSQYVHGSKLDENQSAETFLDDILEYGRRSLVTFLQLEEESGKDSLISKIDSSSINPEALSSLESFLEEECEL